VGGELIQSYTIKKLCSQAGRSIRRANVAYGRDPAALRVCFDTTVDFDAKD
jgi:hypothetical protein